MARCRAIDDQQCASRMVVQRRIAREPSATAVATVAGFFAGLAIVDGDKAAIISLSYNFV